MTTKRLITAGARELRPVLRETTRQLISERLGVELSTVWRWADGRSRPSLDQALALQDGWGIDVASWRMSP